jgi:hypothetical protein
MENLCTQDRPAGPAPGELGLPWNIAQTFSLEAEHTEQFRSEATLGGHTPSRRIHHEGLYGRKNSPFLVRYIAGSRQLLRQMFHEVCSLRSNAIDDGAN